MKKKLIIGIIAIFMLLVVSVPNALAYFSTYARVKGSSQLHLNEKVDIEEGSHNGNKLITLTIDDDSDDVYVRVKAFAASAVLENLTYSVVNDWTESDGENCKIYTYKEILSTGSEDTRTATIELIVDADAVGMETFDLVVVYEYCPVTGDTPDWTSENINFVPNPNQNGGE